MTAPDFPPSTQAAAAATNATQWPRDGTASIASQLKSGYNHAVSAIWQAERQLHKVSAPDVTCSMGCNMLNKNPAGHVHLPRFPVG
jgi:hypothetical protein